MRSNRVKMSSLYILWCQGRRYTVQSVDWKSSESESQMLWTMHLSLIYRHYRQWYYYIKRERESDRHRWRWLIVWRVAAAAAARLLAASKIEKWWNTLHTQLYRSLLAKYLFFKIMSCKTNYMNLIWHVRKICWTTLATIWNNQRGHSCVTNVFFSFPPSVFCHLYSI